MMKGMSFWRWFGLAGVIATVGMFGYGFVLMAGAARGHGTFTEALQIQVLGMLVGWGCLSLVRRKISSDNDQGH